MFNPDWFDCWIKIRHVPELVKITSSTSNAYRYQPWLAENYPAIRLEAIKIIHNWKEETSEKLHLCNSEDYHFKQLFEDSCSVITEDHSQTNNFAPRKRIMFGEWEIVGMCKTVCFTFVFQAASTVYSSNPPVQNRENKRKLPFEMCTPLHAFEVGKKY